MDNKKVLDIFSWGKHLVFQFDNFGLRVHFMLYGSFTSTVEGKAVTGDYARKEGREPRLALGFVNGSIEMYSCSVKFIEDKNIKSTYDFTSDIMSPAWDPKNALVKVLSEPERQIDDVLLDQNIFAGVGNIIKSEVLSLCRVNPEEKIRNISKPKLREVIKTAQSFSKQFYEWRKEFVLRKNLKIYRKKSCPHCAGPVIRKKTGKTERWSYYCPLCQKI